VSGLMFVRHEKLGDSLAEPTSGSSTGNGDRSILAFSRAPSRPWPMVSPSGCVIQSMAVAVPFIHFNPASKPQLPLLC
jgi:hypothetical protein